MKMMEVCSATLKNSGEEIVPSNSVSGTRSSSDVPISETNGSVESAERSGSKESVTDDKVPDIEDVGVCKYTGQVPSNANNTEHTIEKSSSISFIENEDVTPVSPSSVKDSVLSKEILSLNKNCEEGSNSSCVYEDSDSPGDFMSTVSGTTGKELMEFENCELASVEHSVEVEGIKNISSEPNSICAEENIHNSRTATEETDTSSNKIVANADCEIPNREVKENNGECGVLNTNPVQNIAVSGILKKEDRKESDLRDFRKKPRPAGERLKDGNTVSADVKENKIEKEKKKGVSLYNSEETSNVARDSTQCLIVKSSGVEVSKKQSVELRPPLLNEVLYKCVNCSFSNTKLETLSTHFETCPRKRKPELNQSSNHSDGEPSRKVQSLGHNLRSRTSKTPVPIISKVNSNSSVSQHPTMTKSHIVITQPTQLSSASKTQLAISPQTQLPVSSKIQLAIAPQSQYSSVSKTQLAVTSQAQLSSVSKPQIIIPSSTQLTSASKAQLVFSSQTSLPVVSNVSQPITSQAQMSPSSKAQIILSSQGQLPNSPTTQLAISHPARLPIVQQPPLTLSPQGHLTISSGQAQFLIATKPVQQNATATSQPTLLGLGIGTNPALAPKNIVLLPNLVLSPMTPAAGKQNGKQAVSTVQGQYIIQHTSPTQGGLTSVQVPQNILYPAQTSIGQPQQVLLSPIYTVPTSQVSKSATKVVSQSAPQPKFSLAPSVPKQPVAATSASATNTKPVEQSRRKTPASNQATFICEICDDYVKDLDKLRNHMQCLHEIHIHPKMMPSFNCQKCQFCFFTEQGLERHLVGSHGLVTAGMQEAADNGKDGGRCPICGWGYQNKLLDHIATDHKVSLKPADLSYKCTLCTATFGVYKQFENHVYSEHRPAISKLARRNSHSSSHAIK